MTSPYAIRHQGVEDFALPPDRLWREITDARRFEDWWSWLCNVRLEPDRVASGTTLMFSIVTPLPYQMDCRVHFAEVDEPRWIRTEVAGELRGWANLTVEAHGDGSRITLEWELEPTATPLKLLVRVARPLVVRTKDWAIDLALAAFRRNVGA